MTKNIFISSETFEEFQGTFQERCKDVTYDNIKSHKKRGLHPLPRRYIVGKTFGGLGQIDPTATEKLI